MKRLLLLISSGLLLLILLMVILGPSWSGRYIEQWLVTTAANNGLSLRFGSCRGHLLGFSGQDAELAYIAPPLPGTLLINDFRVESSWGGLFRLRPEFSFSAELYQGTADGNLTYHPAANIQFSPIFISGLQLGEHPLLAGLGLTSGKLNVNIHDLQITGGVPVSGRFNVAIDDLGKDQETLIPAFLSGLSENIIIPPLTKISLKLEGTIENQGLKILNLSIVSTAVRLRGLGAISLIPRNQQESHFFRAQFTLSREGQKWITPLISKLTGQTLPVETKTFLLISQNDRLVITPLDHSRSSRS